MNANNMSSLNDKIGGLNHEMREDMIKFHRGLYSKEDQEAYPYMLQLDKALKENDVKTINKYWCPLKKFGDFRDFYFIGQPMCRTYK